MTTSFLCLLYTPSLDGSPYPNVLSISINAQDIAQELGPNKVCGPDDSGSSSHTG